MDQNDKSHDKPALTHAEIMRQADLLLSEDEGLFEKTTRPKKLRFDVLAESGDESISMRSGADTLGSARIMKDTSQRDLPRRAKAKLGIEVSGDIYRLASIDVAETHRGIGLGGDLYLCALAQHPENWYYNAQASASAHQSLSKLSERGFIEFHKFSNTSELDDAGPHIKRITPKGIEHIRSLSGELPSSARRTPASSDAESLADEPVEPAATERPKLGRMPKGADFGSSVAKTNASILGRPADEAIWVFGRRRSRGYRDPVKLDRVIDLLGQIVQVSDKVDTPVGPQAPSAIGHLSQASTQQRPDATATGTGPAAEDENAMLKMLADNLMRATTAV